MDLGSRFGTIYERQIRSRARPTSAALSSRPLPWLRVPQCRMGVWRFDLTREET